MNILITRPLIESEDLMGKLFSLGHKIVHIPTLKISASNANPVDAKKYDAFIFTSANAIRNLKLNNQDNSKICFCVGSITEKIVRQKGYNNTISAGGTVNALKNIILNSDQIDKKKSIAYFCGDYISSDLDIELKNDDEVKKLLRKINDTETEICAKSERAMLQAIKGDCETAVGGLAIIENNNLKFTAQLFSDSGLKSYEYELMGKTNEAVNIGKSVGEELLKLAGSEFKKK